MTDVFACPFCGGHITHFATGYSEYAYGCDTCESGFAIDADTDTVRARKWDKLAAKGVLSEFKLSEMAAARPAVMDPVQRLATPEALEASYAALADCIPGEGGTLEAWEGCFKAWNDYKCWLSGEATRRSFKEAQDGRDVGAEMDARYMREQILPIAEAGDARLREAFLASPQRPALEHALGSQLFLRLSMDQAAFSTENIALQTEEGETVSQYDRLWGTAEIPVAGGHVTLPRANALLNDPDEAIRKAAWQGIGRWTEERKEHLHTLFDRLTELRHTMATNLGEENFVALGYRKMGRSDYGPDEVAGLREGIRTHVVPVVKRLREAQAKMLNKPSVQAWDMAHFPGLSLGPEVVPVGRQLEQASALFQRLHPKLAGHFERMRAQKLIDLESRPGKRPGAFACSFEDENKVAIFCNSTGNEGDVATLTHEMGHAFQAWESQWIGPLELRLPTLDAAELTSMGMEFLALKEITAFFTEEQATRFRKLKLMTTLTRLAYIAVVDAFQHWIYSHPGHSHAEREAAWASLWDEFTPGVDFTGEEEHKRLRWMRQAHIFAAPFYYIDYAIAEVGALQLWRLANEDHPKALASYLEVCRLGGTQSLLGLFEAGGLKSPFAPETLGELMSDLVVAMEV